jgi:23S rRNA U2552 (ribose-2'-O)-methylase RlmE/FtsJ
MERSYVVFTDPRFVNEARGELNGLFGARCIDQRPLYGQIITFRSDMDYAEVAKIFSDGRPAFLYSPLEVGKTLDFGGDYSGIISALSVLLDKSLRFKIEVKNIWVESHEAAKTIEVRIGRELEKLGFLADLSDPDSMVYVVIVNNKALLSVLDARAYGAYVLDQFRRDNKSGYSALNRSEFKLAEAAEAFGMKVTHGTRCLDIGAAPGGWSNYMLKKGASVVAVDSAALDYEKLGAGTILVVANDADAHPLNGGRINVAGLDGLAGDLSKYDLIHIKSNVQNMISSALAKLGKFDIVLLDMNIAPEESAKVLAELAGSIVDGGRAVLTIKLIDNDVQKHVNKVESILASRYGDFMLKKLPHNRKEITIYATKNKLS